MAIVRSYVQELINHAIVSELEFKDSWKVFDLQFPILEKQYLVNAELLSKVLPENKYVDGNRIIWLLTQKETTLVANAIARINKYLKYILKGRVPTMEELGKDQVLLDAGIALEKSYGKDAGKGDNVIGKWTPIQNGTKVDFTVGTYQYMTLRYIGTSWLGVSVLSSPGNLLRFGGMVKVITEDGAFKEEKLYYEKVGGEYVMLEPGKDYRFGDIIADFGSTVYNDSVLEAEFDASYTDFVTGVPLGPTMHDVIAAKKAEFLDGTFRAKYGDRTTFARQEPTVIKFTYDSYEEIAAIVTYNGKTYTLQDASYKFNGGVITNIEELNDKGVALFQYDKNYDWEKDVALNKSITSNLHIRKLIKGWFGHGKSGWSRDINSLPYTQTLDEHDWARVYKGHVKNYIDLVRSVKVEDLLHLVNGDESKFYLLFTIANLYAIRHELLCIYFRALNEIRKKGVY